MINITTISKSLRSGSFGSNDLRPKLSQLSAAYMKYPLINTSMKLCIINTLFNANGFRWAIILGPNFITNANHMAIIVTNIAGPPLINNQLSIDESIRLSGDVFENVLQTNDVVKALADIEPYCLFGQLARLFKLLYWTYFDTHAGIGPVNAEICGQLMDTELEKYPKNLMLNIFGSKLDQINGKIDVAIDSYHRLLGDPHVTPRRFIYFELTWCYALQSDWPRCIGYAEKFRTNSFYSPAIATYMEAVFRYTEWTITDESVAKDNATELFKLVPTLRIRHLGKTITPEKVAVVSAQNYIKNGELLILPDVAILYDLNYFSLIRSDTVLLNKFMDRITECELKYQCDIDSSDYLDNYLIAIFYKGVVFRLMSDFKKATECQQIIIDNESRIGGQFSLPAQAVLEMGLIEYEMKNTEKAIDLLNKCINEYTGYLNENYVHIKAFTALRGLGVCHTKQTDNEHLLEEYKKQWLKDINIDQKSYDKVVEIEDKNEI
ncbi:unnamed protein product [Medioppia subpectinata]|uniref:Uncharacterized protein n=1 Tax=Medioppia subpectinata TaxID=1979941 RepID=A0A7R9KTS8_9ACAR|nr:unnamed protein product [Medioppia subpectinata]CAG2109684.1 unnamed protein product [Medioppia subpectinata]